MARNRVPRADPELFRPGRGAPDGARQDTHCILFRGTALGTLSARAACHRRDDHRLASRHLGRVFADTTGRSARPASANGNPPHLRNGVRANLCAAHQRDSLRRGCADRPHLPVVKRAGCGVWDRRHGYHGAEHCARRHCRRQAVALEKTLRLARLRRARLH